jgi:hypothetical protein
MQPHRVNRDVFHFSELLETRASTATARKRPAFTRLTAIIHSFPPASKQASKTKTHLPPLPAHPQSTHQAPPSLTESKSVASSAHNGSFDVLTSKQSVLVRHAGQSSSRSRVFARTEIITVGDSKTVFFRELRGQGIFDADEDVAFD